MAIVCAIPQNAAEKKMRVDLAPVPGMDVLRMRSCFEQEQAGGKAGWKC